MFVCYFFVTFVLDLKEHISPLRLSDKHRAFKELVINWVLIIT